MENDPAPRSRGAFGCGRIGDVCRRGVYAQSGVVGNVPAGAQVLGSPALPAGEARRVMATLPRVPALLHTVRRLEKRVAELERRLAMADDTRR